jgi:hypothetical protein
MIRRIARFALAGAVVLALTAAPASHADGTETLGTPSVPIADGSDLLVAGVGTEQHSGTPAPFSFTVPAGASIKQVLVYWQGQITAGGQPDDVISLNGNSITGTLIGGPSNPFAQEQFYTYRADISTLDLVSTGDNTLTVSEMNFQSDLFYPTGNKGVGLAVIYDDGSPSTVADLNDGQDYAFAGFASPFDTTVAQTTTFAAATSPREATLGILAGGARGSDSVGVPGNVIVGEFDTGETFSLVNELQSNQGLEFDARNFPLTIPAGATSLTVRLLSQGGDRPGSLLWILGSLTVDVEEPEPEPGGEGCTPGYWKNHLDSWVPTGFSPTQQLATVFSPSGLGSLGTATLLDALKFKGGSSLTAKKQILLRTAVASLLNAAHPDVSFGSPADVIAAVNAALATGDADTILGLAGSLDEQNNAGCPLN